MMGSQVRVLQAAPLFFSFEHRIMPRAPSGTVAHAQTKLARKTAPIVCLQRDARTLPDQNSVQFSCFRAALPEKAAAAMRWSFCGWLRAGCAAGAGS